MLINAYDTTVGKKYKATDGVEATIKALHVSRTLTPTKKDGVFVLTHETTLPIPAFAFPITMQAYNRDIITVYDERPYRNKGNDAVVNQNEAVIIRLAAFLQHDVAEGNIAPVKNCRMVATKAFSEAVASVLSRRGGLDVNETMTLKVLLGYFFVGLQEENNSDLILVATNVIRSIYGSEKGYILGVVEELPKMATLEDLLDAISSNPVLYKLKATEMKDLMTVMGGISFAALGNKVILAACETPCLFTALVYGAIRFKAAYHKTKIGEALDPKYNKETLASLQKHIDYTYDLNG